MELKEYQKDEHLGFKYTLKAVLGDPRIWMTGVSLFGLNIIRYGFMYWAPTYMFEVEKAAVSTAAALGAFFAGWSPDRFFKS